jgi:DNA processing protein
MRTFALPEPPRLLRRGEADWPERLDDLPDAPDALRIAGSLPELTRAVAIVGTRYSDPDAVAFATQLAASLALLGACVISGGARGVDAAAHEGALEVGGSTVAVLATGFAKPYPREHAGLFSRIATSGALLCEGPDPDRVYQGAFLQRNRLIAALAEVVVVVQAPLRSGALSTAAWAKRLKRPVFAVPSAPWDPRGLGCLGLLRAGARICTSATDVLSLPASKGGQQSLALPTTGPQRPARCAKNTNDDAGLSESARLVLRALGRGRKHPDELCGELDMSVGRLQDALLTLVLAGLAGQASDGSYQKVRD